MSSNITNKSRAKVAAIGAGSYVFSLSLLQDLIIDHRLNGIHLTLMDIDGEMAADMAAIARRMADEAGVEMTIDSTSDREAALKDADFVTTSVAAQLVKRWEMDKEVIRKYKIKEILSECGGVGGLSYTLRSVPLILGIAKDMERLCPDAWLLNMSNPLPRVITAINRHTSIKSLGFCNNAYGGVDGYRQISNFLNCELSSIKVITAGLNHFTWLLGVSDTNTGKDLMPAINEQLKDEWVGGPVCMKYWRECGCLPLGGDSHVGEFVPFEPEMSEEHTAHHGTGDERAIRRQEIREAANGERPWQYLAENYGRSWERPADVIQAIVTGNERYLDMVNLVNNGAISNLPNNAVVEAPAVVANGTVKAVEVGPLPEKAADICAKVSEAHSLAAEAAVTGDREILAEAIQVDPAITDKQAAAQAMDELIKIHSDLLPQFK